MNTPNSKTQNVALIRRNIAEILEINIDKIHYNPIKKQAIINLKRNRHITICTHQLERMKRMFSCDDIIISSPYRCVINLKFWYNSEEQCKCRCSD